MPAVEEGHGLDRLVVPEHHRLGGGKVLAAALLRFVPPLAEQNHQASRFCWPVWSVHPFSPPGRLGGGGCQVAGLRLREGQVLVHSPSDIVEVELETAQVS